MKVVSLMTILQSVTLVKGGLEKRKFKEIPLDKMIRYIFTKLKVTGFLYHIPKSRRPSLEREKVSIITQIYLHKSCSYLRTVVNETFRRLLTM